MIICDSSSIFLLVLKKLFCVVEKCNHTEYVWWAKVKKVKKQMKKRKQCAGLQCELGQRRETRSAWVGGSEAAAVGEWSGPLLRNSFLNTWTGWNPIGRPRKKTFCYQFWYFLFRFISTVEEKSTIGILFFTYNCDNMAIQLRYSTHTSKELHK